MECCYPKIFLPVTSIWGFFKISGEECCFYELCSFWLAFQTARWGSCWAASTVASIFLCYRTEVQAPLQSALHLCSLRGFLELSFRGPHLSDISQIWGTYFFSFESKRFIWLFRRYSDTFFGAILSTFPPQNLTIFPHFHLPDCTKHQIRACQFSGCNMT